MKDKIEHTQEQYGLRRDATEFPMMSVLSFAYPCNARCPHCPYNNSNIRDNFKQTPFMPERTFKKIADESGPYGAFLRISGGGEPMLHPQAVELLVYAKKAGCKIGLITNGSRFTPEGLEKLIEAEVDMIEFSVDARDAETYAMVRTGLKWDTLLKNARDAVGIRNGMKSRSKIVASGVNQKGVDIDSVEKFWVSDVGMDNFIKRKFLTWGVNTTLDGGRSGDSTPYIEKGSIPCPFLFERLNIDSTGNIMLCGYDIASNTSMGNVNERTIREIWLGKEFEWHRQMHLAGRGAEIGICSTCPDWQYRSWKHNYWNVVKNAEISRSAKLGEADDFQMEAE